MTHPRELDRPLGSPQGPAVSGRLHLHPGIFARAAVRLDIEKQTGEMSGIKRINTADRNPKPSEQHFLYEDGKRMASLIMFVLLSLSYQGLFAANDTSPDETSLPSRANR